MYIPSCGRFQWQFSLPQHQGSRPSQEGEEVGERRQDAQRERGKVCRMTLIKTEVYTVDVLFV